MRAAHWGFLRRAWKPLTLITGFVGVLAVISWFWFPGTDRVRSFISGALVVAGVAAMREAVFSATGTTAKRSGIDGEAWTAIELRRARRNGWLILHGLPLQFGDVDHIAIGRGRVLIFETKWSSKPWSFDGRDDRLVSATGQARHSAERVAKLLGSLGISAMVRGVVVLWGRVEGEIPEREAIDRTGDPVAIVYGTKLGAFLENVRVGDGLDHEHAWNVLATVIEERDAFEAKRNPEPVRWTTRAWQLLAGAATGSLVSVGLVSLVVDVFGQRSDVGGFLIAGGLLAFASWAGFVWRRFPRGLAVLAFGALLGLLPFLVLITVAIVRAFV